MANIFKSKFTGEQIEDLLDKTDGLSVNGDAADDLESITIDGKTYHLPQPEAPTTVVANPSGSGSTELTKLQVGDTIYNVPQPETPITVEANPQGDATEELDKLKVGNTIYETPRPIDVVANPAGVGETDLTKLRVGSTVYNIPQPEAPTTVIANPVGGGDIDLHSIQVGDVKYNIVEPETVVANPLQEPTVILSKLQIGSTVYSILSGGAPIEISTEAAMNAVLEGAQVGAIFKYVGETTSTYENGALYVVEEEEVQPTIQIGTYVAVDSPTGLGETRSADIEFTSNNQNFTKMSTRFGDMWSELVYGETIVCQPDFSGWENDAYKTIVIATPQVVSAEFYEWFTENFNMTSGGALN